MKIHLRKALTQILVNSSSLHVDAWTNILRAEYFFLKIVWSTIFFVNASLCAWFILGTFQEWNSNHVSTVLRIHSEAHSIFPSVTFCNSNPFTSDYAVSLLQQANVTRLYGDPHDNFLAYLKIQQHLNNTRGSYLNITEKQALSDLKHMLISCSFQDLPCNTSDFTFMFHPYYIGCYRFNEDATRMTYMAGHENELKLELYTGLPDAFNMPYTRGFNIFVQNATEYPLSQVMIFFQ